MTRTKLSRQFLKQLKSNLLPPIHLIYRLDLNPTHFRIEFSDGSFLNLDVTTPAAKTFWSFWSWFTAGERERQGGWVELVCDTAPPAQVTSPVISVLELPQKV